MAAKRSTTARILVLLAQRAGAALGLGIAIAFARGFWDAALEGFGEGVAEGLGGSVIALVVTGLALVLVYATLGTQVDQVAVRLVSLVAKKREKTNAGRSEIVAAAIADLLAVPLYVVLALLLVIAGIREAHATWTMLGFAAVALAALSFVSMIAQAWTLQRMRRRGVPKGKDDILDAKRVGKGGEIAGVFVSLAVLALTVSASVFASLPAYRYSESGWPLAFGDWARLCIGEASGCRTRQVLTFKPEAGQKTRIEVVSSQTASLRAKGQPVALDAAGRPVRLVRSKDSAYDAAAVFLPAPNTTYEVLVETAGHYSIRYRSAR